MDVGALMGSRGPCLFVIQSKSVITTGLGLDSVFQMLVRRKCFKCLGGVKLREEVI